MEWDDRKAVANQKKHGLSFALAERFPFESALEALDLESEDHGEERILAIGKIERAFYALCYTRRGEKIRVISFRKATAYERRRSREGG
jgi:uncharacterized DUF497 family protein